MKKEWKKPELEVLNVGMTELGDQNMGIDATFVDFSDGETVHLHS